jgi:hypothetical protein
MAAEVLTLRWDEQVEIAFVACATNNSAAGKSGSAL